MSKRRMEQIRQRWWVLVVVAALGVLVAAASSLSMHPTYLGRSTLVLSTSAPQQDALMVVGYMTIFNDPATIARLRTTTKIPEDVTFEARTVAASPILAIEATADDPKVAQDAAYDMAEALRADISASQWAGIDGYIADLERQLAEIPPVDPAGGTNDYYASLQERIDSARALKSNALGLLQPRAGVTEHAPSLVSRLVQGAAGGLVLGILAALGLAALSTRLTNAADLRDKTGVAPLVEVPAAGSGKLKRVRQERLRTLANLISLEDLPKPTVIALTDSRGGGEARGVAEALAELSAQQGGRTVLVYADNHASPPAGGAGFNDVLADSGLVHQVLKDGDVESLKILPAGSTLADRYPLVTRDRIDAVFGKLRTDADTIIVAAPSIAETTDAQLVCAAADATILVVTRGSSRASEVTSAAEALAKAHAVHLGAVLIDGTNGKKWGPRFARRRTPGTASNPRTERPDGQQFAASRQQPAEPSHHRNQSLRPAGFTRRGRGPNKITPESAPMTGSFARTGLQVGSRPQGWMTAPIFAALVTLVVTFLHFAIKDELPGKARLILIVMVVIATARWMDVTPTRLRGIGAVEWAMALYLMWNAYSMLAPHEYPSIIPLTGVYFSPAHFIMSGTVIPFMMYVVGRYTFDRTAAVRVLLWTILTLAAYSAG